MPAAQAPASRSPPYGDPSRARHRRGSPVTARSAPYQTAVIRIGFSRDLAAVPAARVAAPPGAVRARRPLELGHGAEQLIDGNHAFTVLMWSDSRGLVRDRLRRSPSLSSALLLLGWRTRTMSVLFMVGVLSLQNRSIFMGDGGDNVIHLMAIYLVLTRCGQVWSLDARRAAPRRAGGTRARRAPVPDRAGVGPVGRARPRPGRRPRWSADSASSWLDDGRCCWAAVGWSQGLWWTVGRARAARARRAARSCWTSSPTSRTTAHCW